MKIVHYDSDIIKIEILIRIIAYNSNEEQRADTVRRLHDYMRNSRTDFNCLE